MKISKNMKNIIIIFSALIFIPSIYASDIDLNEKDKEILIEDRELLCEAAKDRTWIFETSTNWTAGNLAYGPVEIIAGAGAPVIGLFALNPGMIPGHAFWF